MVNKVLMFHGYAQSASIFSKRMGALRKACGKDVDFVFIDAPHILQPADMAGFNTSTLGASEAAGEPNPENQPRGWWTFNAEKTTYAGAAESLNSLAEILRQDTFDGVFGFSQGAAMAALLTAVLEKPDLYPPFLADGKAIHPPMKFCIAACGFKPIDSEWVKFFDPEFVTPTLHILGKNDTIISPERVNTLIQVSANRIVAAHDGGHFVPSKAPWRSYLREFLISKDPTSDIPLPPTSEDVLSFASSLVGPSRAFKSTSPIPAPSDS